MISRGEIKKCGFTPHTAEFIALIGQPDKRVFYRKIPTGYAIIDFFNEEEGSMTLRKQHNETQCTWVFQGNIPTRHELKVILRCTGIA